MMCANNRVHYGMMVVFVCLHFILPHHHHYAYVSETIELIKCFCPTVCLRWSQFSQLSFLQYMGLCVFSLPIHLMMILGISYYHHCHCWGLGHETMLCAVCLYIFLLIIYLRQMMRVAFGDILLHSYQIKSSNKSIKPTDLVDQQNTRLLFISIFKIYVTLCIIHT